MSDARLSELLALQSELERVLGHIFPQDDATTSQTVRDMVLACTDELHEALAEVAWKPWATTKGIVNRDAYVGELVDALHFLLVLFLAAGATAEEVGAAYREKVTRNIARHRAGYDGVTGKCIICHRAKDDLDLHTVETDHEHVWA